MKDRALADIVAAFAGKRVLIIGDVMLDEYIWGEVQRISPEAPVPVVEIHHRTYVAGGAANAAANVLSLGGQALLGGVVGRDYQAEILSKVLAQNQVNSAGLVVDDRRPTTTKTRIVAHNQQVGRMDSEQRSPLSPELEDQVLQWLASQLGMVDACILSDYGKGVVSPGLAQRLMQLATSLAKPIVVDPKGTNYGKYRGATVITPNVPEARRALNLGVDDAVELGEIGHQLLEMLPNSAILVTRGAEGMSLFQGAIPSVHIPAVARKVFDVTGAGDTVVSAIAMALAAGASLEDAAWLASRAAGLVVGKVGTATVSLAELTQELLTTEL